MKKLILALWAALLVVRSFAAQVPEKEPNNTIAGAQPILLADTVTGIVSSASDWDGYRIQLPVGAYTIAFSYPSGVGNFNDWFDLVDVNFVAIEPHRCYWVGGNVVQVLHVKVCAPVAAYFTVQMNQAAGQPTGKNYRFWILNDKGDPECDDQASTANVLTQPGVWQSRLATAGDEDWVKIPNVGTGPFSAAVNNPTENIPFSMQLFKDPAGAALASATQGSLNTSIAQPGAYYLRIRYANPDTASRFGYLTSIVYSATACVPVVGITNIQKAGRKATLSAVIQNADSVAVNWGDFTVNDTLVHEYAADGSYTVTITAFNACGSTTATAQLNVLLIECDVLFLENVPPNDTIKVPVVVLNGEAQVAGLTGTLSMSNPAAGQFIGFASGTLNTSGFVFNPANGRFATSFAAGGSETLAIGDTLFYLCYLTGSTPGDSTGVDLNGGALPFQFTVFVLGQPEPAATTVLPGGFQIVEDVLLSMLVKTPTGLFVSNVKVEIVTPDTTLSGYTDQQGILAIKVPFAAKYTIRCGKDTTLLVGVENSFLVNRVIVLLQNNGFTAYSYVAADFDCDGQITVSDAVKILQYIVGLIPVPCQQLVFIDGQHVFPAYPDPTYQQFPQEIVINNPNPKTGESRTVIATVRGDLKHTTDPGLTGGGTEDRDPHTATWTYTAREENGFAEALLRADQWLGLAGGSLHFAFDATQFEYVGAEMLQGQAESILVVNDQAATSAGQLKIAFIQRHGQPLRFDAALPLLRLRFRSTQPAVKRDLTLALGQNEMPSRTFDATGKSAEVTLLREENTTPPSAAAEPSCYPNPATSTLWVSLPSGTAERVEVFDMSGNLVFSVENVAGYQVSVPVGHLPSGLYTVLVATSERVFHQQVEVVSGR